MSDSVPATPGIYTLENEVYHSGPGIGKSGLWKLYKRSPYHFRFSPLKDETAAQRFGSASHCAVLEPGLFEQRFTKGPAVNKNSKEWKSAVEIAKAAGKTCVDPEEYEGALRVADVLHRDPIVRQLMDGVPAIEQSAYAIDPETGELIKCRPDAYNYKHKIIADLKNTVDASHGEWVKRLENFGYHVQDAFYSDTWELAGGGGVDAFVFIVVEKDEPHAYQVFELEPSATDEGREIYRKAMAKYHVCMEAERAAGKPDGLWPGYSAGVQKIDLRKFAYRETEKTDV